MMNNRKEEVLKAKKEAALNVLENAKDRLQYVLDEVTYALEKAEDVETATELWDVLSTLSQSMDEAQFAADDVQEAFELADDELEDMMKEEDDDEAEEDEADFEEDVPLVEEADDDDEDGRYKWSGTWKIDTTTGEIVGRREYETE